MAKQSNKQSLDAVVDIIYRVNNRKASLTLIQYHQFKEKGIDMKVLNPDILKNQLPDGFGEQENTDDLS